MSNKEPESPKSEHSEQEGPLPFGEHVEEVSENGRKVRHKGVHLLPNLFTTGALFSGFYAIVSAMHGNFENAAVAIFVAMLLDGMDGRVARLTNTQSAFGEQYDSLADVVSFGVAPALVMFSWALHDLGKWGWAAAFIYTSCAALRLARFNTQIGVVDKKFFVGLASPPAAAVLASIVWTWHRSDIGEFGAIPAAIITAVVGLLMVSNLRYPSFKGFDFRGRVPFVMMLAVVFIFAVLLVDQSRTLLVMSVTYALSAPLIWCWKMLFSRGERDPGQ